MPDLDTQLADYADWLASQTERIGADEAKTAPSPELTVNLEPDGHSTTDARRRRRRLALAAAAAVLLAVLVATLLPTSDRDDVETGPVAPSTDISMGWERIPVEWGGGTPIDVASNGEGILRAVVGTPIDCPSQTFCGPDLDVWESTDDGRTWNRQGSLASGAPSVDGDSENYRSAVAIAGNGSNWIVAGNRSDQPVVWLPTPDGGWAEHELPGRPGLTRAALVRSDGSLLVVGSSEDEAEAWVSADGGDPWVFNFLPSSEPGPGSITSADAPVATSILDLASELVVLGVGGDGNATMWSSIAGQWSVMPVPSRFALARAASDGHTIWAVDATGPSPDGRVALWTRRDQSWQETETPVPWSVDVLALGDRIEIYTRGDAPALAANDSGLVMASHDSDGQALWASPDGVSWAPTDAPTPPGTTIVTITAHGDGFVAVGASNTWIRQP